jgi:hypothetical protein
MMDISYNLISSFECLTPIPRIFALWIIDKFTIQFQINYKSMQSKETTLLVGYNIENSKFY